MKILILGGTGAIGCHLCKILVGAGNNVCVTTRSSRKDGPNLTFITGNAHNLNFLQSLLSQNQ